MAAKSTLTAITLISVLTLSACGGFSLESKARGAQGTCSRTSGSGGGLADKVEFTISNDLDTIDVRSEDEYGEYGPDAFGLNVDGNSFALSSDDYLGNDFSEDNTFTWATEGDLVVVSSTDPNGRDVRFTAPIDDLKDGKFNAEIHVDGDEVDRYRCELD